MKGKEFAALLAEFKKGEILNADGDPMTSLDEFLGYACGKLGIDLAALSDILSM